MGAVFRFSKQEMPWSAPFSDALGNAQLRAAGARVTLQFFLAGQDRLAGDTSQRLHKAAGAHRRLTRAGAAVLPPGDAGLDDPVLEGMKADDAQPPAGTRSLSGAVSIISRTAASSSFTAMRIA